MDKEITTDDKLLEIIKGIIDKKTTHPKVATFVEIRHAVTGDKKLLNKDFKKLIADGKINVMEGVNTNLVEIL